MKNLWPEIALREVLIERQETPHYEDLSTGNQRIISKIRFSDGCIELRKSGETKTNMISIHPGDLVLSGINAMKGAVALYENSDAKKAAATIHYSAYEIRKDRAEPRYLWLLLRHEVFHNILARHVPKGIKTELKANRFLPIPIPLPPLDEQQRIVNRVETFAAKITEAKKLTEYSISERETLFQAIITKHLEGLNRNRILADIMSGKPRNGWSAKCDNEESGVPVLTLSAVTGFKYRETAFKRTSLPTTEGAHYWLNKGDVLISRSNTLEFVGHASIYNGNPSPCIYPDLMMRLPLNLDLVCPEFLIYWLQCKSVRDYIKAKAKGTSPTMKKINQDTVMKIPFPKGIHIEEQRSIVANIDSFVRKLAELNRIQSQAFAEINALMPAVLDRAFRGEL